MGDETIEFASRFSSAVTLLARVGDGGRHPALRVLGDARLAAAVHDALDAVAAVYETGTDAVRRWPERRQRVLAQVAALRAALSRGGVDAEARRLARALVEAIEQASARR